MRPDAVPARARRASLALALALAAGLAAGCTDTSLPGSDAAEQKEDDAARLAHFEEAAQTYYDGGKYGEAVVQWRRVLELEPDRPKANWGLAKSLAMVGTPPALREALQIYGKIVDWDWSSPTLGDRRNDVVKDYAEAYLQLADFYDQDVRALQAQLEEPTADVATLRQHVQTQIARRNDLLAKALPLYQQVIAAAPDNPYVLAGLAKANLMVGDDRAGIQYARRYIEVSERSQKGWEQKQKDWEKERGSITEEQRQLFREKIRGARDKEMKLRLLLGSVLVRNRDYAGAIQEYDRVIQIDPAIPAAYLERGQAYAMSKDYRKAVLDLEQYLKMTDPVKMRQARISAAELLEKYRLLAASQPAGPAPAPTSTYGPGSTGFPPPSPPPAPTPRR